MVPRTPATIPATASARPPSMSSDAAILLSETNPSTAAMTPIGGQRSRLARPTIIAITAKESVWRAIGICTGTSGKGGYPG